MNDHQRVRMLAATRLDFSLDAGDERFLEEHLGACASCRVVAAGLAADQAALRSFALGDLQVPATATGTATGSVVGPMRVPVRIRSRRQPFLAGRAWSLLAALLLLAVAGGVAMVGSERPPAPSPSSVVPSALLPATVPIGTIVTSVPAGAQPAVEPQWCSVTGAWDCVVGIVATDGSVWTTNGQTVTRIDPGTNRVTATIDVGSDPRRMVVDHGFVWVTVAGGDLVRIDPATNRITGRIAVGAEPAAVAAGAGKLWVVRPLSSTVIMLDPVAAKVVDTITVPSRPWGMAVDDRSAWVAMPDAAIPNSARGAVVRIDTATGRIGDMIAVPDAREVILAAGSVWVAGHDAVTRLDASTGVEDRTRSVGNWPNLIAYVNAIWISSAVNGDLRRWNLATDEIDGDLVIRATGPYSFETALTVADGDLWLRSYLDDPILRIRPIAP